MQLQVDTLSGKHISRLFFHPETFTGHRLRNLDNVEVDAGMEEQEHDGMDIDSENDDMDEDY